jgi:hypothetical protein
MHSSPQSATPNLTERLGALELVPPPRPLDGDSTLEAASGLALHVAGPSTMYPVCG